MRGLTLHQPWASMIAIGAKSIETRSWRTEYRGLIAIHAAKIFPPDARDFAMTSRFVRARIPEASTLSSCMPGSAVLAIAELVDVEYITEGLTFKLSEEECALGDYGPGRYAWRLKHVRALRHPYPRAGARGLWPIFERDAENILASVAAP